MHYNSIFQQLFNFIPRYRFEKSVKNLSGDHYCKTFSAWQQFLTCLYAQITGKDSLREIERGLIANLMQNMSLLEVLPWTRKTILKPPDWNLPDQPDLFGDFFY